jgi:hypothetical protein
VVNTVAYATAPRFSKHGDPGLRTRRPSLSAGALHPISVVIIAGTSSSRAFRYNPMNHRLELLLTSKNHVEEVRRTANSVLPNCNGALLVLLADSSRTEQWYTDFAPSVC